jgi:hypothetical protein
MINSSQRNAQSSRRYCGRSKSGSPGARAGHVQHQRKHQVEFAVPETDSEQRFENVVFQRDGRGSREQQHESVENQPMRRSRGRVAAVDGAMTHYRGEHRTEPGPKPALELQGRAAPILADLHVHAVAEYRDRGVTQQVEEPHLGC